MDDRDRCEGALDGAREGALDGAPDGALDDRFELDLRSITEVMLHTRHVFS